MVLDKFYHKVFQSNISASIKDVSERMFRLYGLWSLEKHLATLFQGMISFTSCNLIHLEVIVRQPLPRTIICFHGTLIE